MLKNFIDLKKVNTTNIIAIFAIIVSCVSLAYTYHINKLSAERQRIQSYYEPMTLRLSFSEEFMEGNGYQLNPLLVQTTRGFVSTSRSIYVNPLNDEMVYSSALEYDAEQFKDVQKKQDPDEVVNMLNDTFVNQGESKQLLFGTCFKIFEDYQGEKQNFMIIYVLDKETKKSIQQFIFDEYYLLSLGSDIFPMPPNKLDESQEKLTIDYIKKSIESFKKLTDKLREENLY